MSNRSNVLGLKNVKNCVQVFIDMITFIERHMAVIAAGEGPRLEPANGPQRPQALALAPADPAGLAEDPGRARQVNTVRVLVPVDVLEEIQKLPMAAPWIWPP